MPDRIRAWISKLNVDGVASGWNGQPVWLPRMTWSAWCMRPKTTAPDAKTSNHLLQPASPPRPATLAPPPLPPHPHRPPPPRAAPALAPEHFDLPERVEDPASPHPHLQVPGLGKLPEPPVGLLNRERGLHRHPGRGHLPAFPQGREQLPLGVKGRRPGPPLFTQPRAAATPHTHRRAGAPQ